MAANKELVVKHILPRHSYKLPFPKPTPKNPTATYSPTHTYTQTCTNTETRCSGITQLSAMPPPRIPPTLSTLPIEILHRIGMSLPYSANLSLTFAFPRICIPCRHPRAGQDRKVARYLTIKPGGHACETHARRRVMQEHLLTA